MPLQDDQISVCIQEVCNNEISRDICGVVTGETAMRPQSQGLCCSNAIMKHQKAAAIAKWATSLDPWGINRFRDLCISVHGLFWTMRHTSSATGWLCTYLCLLLMCSLPSVLESRTTEVAPFLLGAIGDKDPETHAVMWGLVLTFAKTFPTSWHAVDVRKSFLPRLQTLLR